MSKKEHLLILLEFGEQETLRFANQISPEEHNSSGEYEHWNERDTLGHIAEWIRRMAANLAAARLGRSPNPRGNIEEENKAIFGRNSRYSWDDILDLVTSGYTSLRDELLMLSEEDLTDAGRFAWLQGRPLWQQIAGSSTLHPISHLGQAYLQRGERDYADQLRLREAELAIDLGDSPSWRGIIQYNLACHYALTNRKQTALERLGAALRQHPDLIAWSQQDSDLESLHKDPDFQVLITDISADLQVPQPALDHGHLVQALSRIVECLEASSSEIEYRLVGTGAALLHGVALPARDIDLLVRQRQAVEAFAAALQGYECKTSPTFLPEARQYFAEFLVEEVEVGISTVEWEAESDGLECIGPGPWQHFTLLPCGRFQIPAVQLELRLVSELSRGRRDRSEPLIVHLAEHGCDTNLLKRGMQARQVPEGTQKQVLEQLRIQAKEL
jgi:tetratricopeptide (TPR) repeat protein